MENKKGFTLIELLAVIVIIAIVSSIATVGVIAIRGVIDESLLDTKKDVLESSAVYWGQDSMVLLVKEISSIDASCLLTDETYDSLQQKVIDNDTTKACTNLYVEFSNNDNFTFTYAIVKSITNLEDYITEGDTCDDTETPCVQNNVTGENMGDDLIFIYVASNRVYANYVEESYFN